MIVEFDKSFLKSIHKLDNHLIKTKAEKLILELENANSISSIYNLKKLSGFKSFYRIKINDYRVGFELLDANRILLITIAHRKNIYMIFP